MASAVDAFDLFAIPFDRTVRVEASAGTGKTYALADLYLRLIAEGRTVDQILVVTYTVAATGELRDRIRRRLVEARRHFEGAPTADATLRALRERAAERAATGRRLVEALRAVDEAAIFTIHGFCQRVLTDCAFEGGQPFGTDLLPDEATLLQEVVDDFWRRTLPSWSPLAVGALLEAGVTPDRLRATIAPYLGQPDLVLDPPASADPVEAEAAYAGAYTGLRALWREGRRAVADLLTAPGVLNGASYPAAKVAGWLETLDAFLAPAAPAFGTCDALGKLAASALARATRKGMATPRHPIFDACDALAATITALDEILARGRRRLVADCLDAVRQELPARKRERKLRGYADLLTNLRDALRAPGGEALAGRIRERYPAALVDEFQDTDPVQYEIFRRAYVGTALPLLLVGDPKQAIYSFRGADVFAYLEARKAPGLDRTLDRNWRADPPLLAALNRLWSRPRYPFVFPEIGYEPVRAADREREALTVEGDAPAPLRVWLLHGRDDGKPGTKGEAADSAVRATVGEITRLLALGAAGRARIGSRPLGGGDIAVLVRSNRQGRQVRDALLAVRVPAVQLVQDTVLASPEAGELARVLAAVTEPGRESAVRSALVTDLLGLTGDELEALGADEAAWERRLEAFRADHERWQAQGFGPMARTLLRREGVAARLLGFRDGERRLTNVFHLVELLEAADDEARLGMTGLLRWLADRRSGDAPAAEEAQLRLESDENLVKIVTVHKSKGLEYGVVFCPFLWDGRLGSDERERKPVAYHDPTRGFRPTLDLGSPREEAARAQARREELAESLRLAYVALTRARHRGYVVWGAVKDGGTAPLAHLFHQPPERGEDLLETVAAHVEGLAAHGIAADVEALAAAADGTIAVTPIPDGAPALLLTAPAAPERLAARSFTGSLAVPWRVASFSAIRREGEAGREAAEDDEPMPATAPAALLPTADIARFPRGPRAGSCLHALFERVDFTQPPDREVVAGTLTAHGFDQAWAPSVERMLADVLACPLDAAASALRLGEVGRGERLDELEFHYPVARVTDAGLRRLLGRHGYGTGTRIRDEVERLTFAPVEGYLRGFIDLVVHRAGRFSLVDYKSNWLGEDGEAYAGDRLAAVMASEGYYLQALIYLVALHRYLRHRLPDYRYARHVGGIYYLFLRGVDPRLGAAAGVYRDRPDERLIEALDRYLATGEE